MNLERDNKRLLEENEDQRRTIYDLSEYKARSKIEIQELKDKVLEMLVIVKE